MFLVNKILIEIEANSLLIKFLGSEFVKLKLRKMAIFKFNISNPTFNFEISLKYRNIF